MTDEAASAVGGQFRIIGGLRLVSIFVPLPVKQLFEGKDRLPEHARSRRGRDILVWRGNFRRFVLQGRIFLVERRASATRFSQ